MQGRPRHIFTVCSGHTRFNLSHGGYYLGSLVSFTMFGLPLCRHPHPACLVWVTAIWWLSDGFTVSDLITLCPDRKDTYLAGDRRDRLRPNSGTAESVLQSMTIIIRIRDAGFGFPSILICISEPFLDMFIFLVSQKVHCVPGAVFPLNGRCRSLMSALSRFSAFNIKSRFVVIVTPEIHLDAVPPCHISFP